jgi:hypothetical protein
MKGDFSRDTFNPLYNFSRVLLQQGRVQLDADFNEQTSILLRMLRRLTADLVGPYAIPADQPNGARAFLIEATAGATPTLTMTGGRAYVGGHLIESEGITYAGNLNNQAAYVVYLDVWERHVTYHETEALIREVALGGPDTATRAQVVARLQVADEFINNDGNVAEVERNLSCADLHDRWPSWVGDDARGTMRARAGQARADEACVVPSDSRYRGLENQLYRVEIHAGDPTNEGNATFKWSRDNGSVVFPLAAAVDGKFVSLVHLGRDERFGLRPGDWVEIVDDNYTLSGAVEPLLEVVAVDPLERKVELSAEPTTGDDMALRPLLRRWDQRAGEESEGGPTLDSGAARIYTGDRDFGWIPLENGIEVQFSQNGAYRTGDYWLIPARTATGDIEWPPDPTPTEPQRGAELPARRAEHYTMPLAVVSFAGQNAGMIDCRRCFGGLTLNDCAPPPGPGEDD